LGLIYLDTCLVIYLVEPHSIWGDKMAELIRQAPDSDFAISPLVKCECLVGPIKRGDPVMREAYVEQFGRLVSLVMPEAVYLLAAELRARSIVATPDALHLACAQHHRCDALWTNDDRLARVSRGFARNVLAA
jgi:predicted nucleic acid-binding protein